MKKKPAKKTKRDPQDLTGRNNRAKKKEIERINQWMEAMTRDILGISKRLERLEYLKERGR